jgi:hypothetical protein
VTGRPPFSSDDDVTKIFGDILNGRRTPADELRPDLPEGFQRIIDRATSRDPVARFPSVRALGNALLTFASPKAALTWASTFSDVDAWRVMPAPPIRRRAFVRRIVAALAGLVALCTVGATAWWTLGPPAPRVIETPTPTTTTTTTTTWRRMVIPAEPRRASPSPDRSLRAPAVIHHHRPAPRTWPSRPARHRMTR